MCLTPEPADCCPDTFPSCRPSRSGGRGQTVLQVCERVWTHQDRVHPHVDPADADHQTPAESQAEAQVEGVLWRRRDKSSAWRHSAAASQRRSVRTFNSSCQDPHGAAATPPPHIRNKTREEKPDPAMNQTKPSFCLRSRERRVTPTCASRASPAALCFAAYHVWPRNQSHSE